MQVGSATSIIRVIKHSGNSSSCKSTSLLQDVKTSLVTSAFCFCSPCLHAYCSIFYQLLVFSRMSRHLMWHPLSAPPVFMLLLQHLLSATSSYSSLHQSSSAAAVSPSKPYSYNSPSRSWIMHTPYPHESCIHRILLSYCHTSYIVSYYSKSCIIASIILLLPLFRQNLTKVECMQILQTNSNQLFKGTCPYS